MKTVTKQMIIGVLALTGLTTYAHAEGGVGNGGGVWVCSADSDSVNVRWAELVDIYEAQNEFEQKPINLKASDYNNNEFAAAKKVLEDRIKPFDIALYQQLVSEVNDVETRFDVKGVKLRIIDDSLYRIVPERARECKSGYVKYVQIANYTKYGKILVSSYIYNDPKFSFSSKVALIGHEAIYSFLRKAPYKNIDSVNTRELNGYIFSEMSEVELQKQVSKLIYGEISRPVQVESKTISSGETLYFEAGTTVLAAPTILSGETYHLELPAGSSVTLYGDYQLASATSENFTSSWVKIFNTQVPVAKKSTVSFDLNGNLNGPVLVAESLITMGGGLRKIPGNTEFQFKDGKPVAIFKLDTKFLLGVAGTKQSTLVGDDGAITGGLRGVQLDQEGYATYGSFSKLKIEVDGKILSVSGATTITNGTVAWTTKANAYDAVHNGYKVSKLDVNAFCKAKGYIVDGRSIHRVPDDYFLQVVKRATFWDFSTNSTKYDENKERIKNYSTKIICQNDIDAKVVD